MSPTSSKQIQSFVLSAAMKEDACGILFRFIDGSTHNASPLPLARFTAILAVLQATPQAYFHVVPAGWFVSSSPDVPGH